MGSIHSVWIGFHTDCLPAHNQRQLKHAWSTPLTQNTNEKPEHFRYQPLVPFPTDPDMFIEIQTEESGGEMWVRHYKQPLHALLKDI